MTVACGHCGEESLLKEVCGRAKAADEQHRAATQPGARKPAHLQRRVQAQPGWSAKKPKRTTSPPRRRGAASLKGVVGDRVAVRKDTIVGTRQMALSRSLPSIKFSNGTGASTRRPTRRTFSLGFDESVCVVYEALECVYDRECAGIATRTALERV